MQKIFLKEIKERAHTMKITKILNVPFTVEELKEIGVKLALENQRKERIDDMKKQSMSQFKSELDAVDSEIRSLSQKLARGSEDRSIECDLLYHTPSEGLKTVRRCDTGEDVEIKKMSDSELEDLFINNLGAQKENHEFVFRDKTRTKLVSSEKFDEFPKKNEFKLIGCYVEKELVDIKKKPDCSLVVSRFDKNKNLEVYDFYEFTGKAAENE